MNHKERTNEMQRYYKYRKQRVKMKVLYFQPKENWLKFENICYLQKKSMNSVICELINKYIEENE